MQWSLSLAFLFTQRRKDQWGISIFIYTKKKRSSENEVKETATVDVNELYGTGEEEYYDDTEVKDYNDYYEE